jgi:hypothetical protein
VVRQDLAVTVVGGDVDVGKTVAIDIAGDGREADGRNRDAGLMGNIPELEPVVGDETVFEEHLVADGGEEEVEVAVVVEVEQQCGDDISVDLSHPGRGRRVVEGAVTPVEVEGVAVLGCDDEIDETVIVHVANRGAIGGERWTFAGEEGRIGPIDAGGDSDLGKNIALSNEGFDLFKFKLVDGPALCRPFNGSSHVGATAKPRQPTLRITPYDRDRNLSRDRAFYEVRFLDLEANVLEI